MKIVWEVILVLLRFIGGPLVPFLIFMGCVVIFGLKIENLRFLTFAYLLVTYIVFFTYVAFWYAFAKDPKLTFASAFGASTLMGLTLSILFFVLYTVIFYLEEDSRGDIYLALRHVLGYTVFSIFSGISFCWFAFNEKGEKRSKA